MADDYPTLPRHGDLVVRGTDAAAFGPALNAHLSEGWTRDTEIEEGWPSRTTGSRTPLVFRFPGSDDLEAARLYLFQDGANSLYVSNVVPDEVGQLTEPQYNALLAHFEQHVAGPAAQSIGAQTDLDVVDYDLAERAGVEVRDSLARFSRTANRGTGTSHPSDQERFFAFLIAAHRLPDDRRPGPTTVGRWLVADGWRDEMATDIAIEYEQGLALLKQYDLDA